VTVVLALPILTGDSDKAEMKTYLQLVVDRPNACGVRFNIQ
jgi:hypothetical protein